MNYAEDWKRRDAQRQDEDAMDYSYIRQWGFPRYAAERERPGVQAQNNALMFLDSLPERGMNALRTFDAGAREIHSNEPTLEDLAMMYAQMKDDMAYTGPKATPGPDVMNEAILGMGRYVRGNLQRQPVFGAGNPRRNSLASNY